MTKILLILIATFVGWKAHAAAEPLGEIAVHRLLVEPSFQAAEPKTASFSLSRMLVGFRWKNDARWWAEIVVGNLELLGRPARYGENLTGHGLLEAFGEYESGIGNFRAGLIPINYGMETGSREEVLVFPRSLIYQKRFLSIRDVGLNYFIQQKNFFTSLAVHNGEGNTDLDNRAWVTAKWAYRRPHEEFGISAQVGQTNSLSTGVATDLSQDEFFTSTDEHKLRLGSLYGYKDSERFETHASVYLAEVLGEQNLTRQFAGGTFDLRWKWTDQNHFLLRYDELRSNPSTGRHKEMQVILGMAIHNWNQTSTVFVYAIKNLAEPVERADDRLQISWRYTPVGFDL